MSFTSLPDLRAVAKGVGIKGYSKMNKHDLVQTLDKADVDVEKLDDMLYEEYSKQYEVVEDEGKKWEDTYNKLEKEFEKTIEKELPKKEIAQIKQMFKKKKAQLVKDYKVAIKEVEEKFKTNYAKERVNVVDKFLKDPLIKVRKPNVKMELTATELRELAKKYSILGYIIENDKETTTVNYSKMKKEDLEESLRRGNVDIDRLYSMLSKSHTKHGDRDKVFVEFYKNPWIKKITLNEVIGKFDEITEMVKGFDKKKKK